MAIRVGTSALALCATLLLPCGAALAGGAATPQVLQGLFVFNDEDEGGANCANIEIDGDTHQVTGVVTSVGLNGDTVTLTYSTPFVENVAASEERGAVSQKHQAQLDVEIVPGAGSTTLAYTGVANPDRGRIAGLVRRGGTNSRAKAHFDLDANLGALAPAPDADQLTTILTAFEDRDDVSINAKKGRIAIEHRGIVNPTQCPEIPGAPPAGATVPPEILQDSFFFNDDREGPDHCSDVEMDGIVHSVTGIATDVGLSDDTVTLTYTTPFVERVAVRTENGRVQQGGQAQITVDVVPGATSTTLAYTGTSQPDKGRVAARVVKEGNEARVIAGFRLDQDLAALNPAPDAAQLATILAAYADRDDVKVRQKSGNVRLKQDGLKTFGCGGPGQGP